MKQVAVIIVAGGKGKRMGSALPKQFLPLAGRPILMHTIERFATALPGCRIVVVLPHDRHSFWQTLCAEHGFALPHRVCDGGATRFESVRNGLAEIGDAEVIAVHDGVRPLVTSELIRRVVEAAEQSGAAIPVVLPNDSLREIELEGESRIVDRSRYRMVQTPQVFRRSVLLEAYRQPYNNAFTDDASVVEYAGGTMALCEGDYANLKITTPTDCLIAEVLMKRQSESQA